MSKLLKLSLFQKLYFRGVGKDAQELY